MIATQASGRTSCFQSAGALTLGDAQVVTHLPLPGTSSADVSIEVPIHNSSGQPLEARLHAEFEGVVVEKT